MKPQNLRPGPMIAHMPVAHAQSLNIKPSLSSTEPDGGRMRGQTHTSKGKAILLLNSVSYYKLHNSSDMDSPKIKKKTPVSLLSL